MFAIRVAPGQSSGSTASGPHTTHDPARFELVQPLQEVLGDATGPADPDPARVDEHGPRSGRAHSATPRFATASARMRSNMSIERSHVNSADFASAARLIDARSVGRVVQARDRGGELVGRAGLARGGR